MGLLEVCELGCRFGLPGGGFVCALDGVSLSVGVGESVGVVGESGSGKSTLARCAMGLIRPTSGRVLFEGRDVSELRGGARLAWRRSMSMVFQDPVGSLNPRMRVGAIVGEPLRVHGIARGSSLRVRVGGLLERCGLSAADADRYPHSFSGGQRQRIGLARALATEPRCVILDEPTSALDVSVQAQILNLLRDLQDERGLSYVFISHDIAVVHHLCDRIAVMRSGKIVESGSCVSVVESPSHSYTQALVRSVPTF